MLKINDLNAKIGAHQQQIMAAITRVVNSGWVVLGPEVKEFERRFSAFLDVRHCISVANGTDAIELALKALGVQKGDKVATIANAGMYTTTCILAMHAQPFFLDVDPVTQLVTLAEVNRAVDAGVAAVVVTHLYGVIAPEIEQIAQVCRSKGVPLLEDCAQAHGASLGGKRAGSFGNAASFSFYPTKNLGALGDGGAVVTDDSAIAERLGRLRQYGWSSKYRVELAGARNSRLDEMQAAVLSVFLDHLEDWNDKRRAIAKRYTDEIINPKVITPQVMGRESVAHLYVICTEQRGALQQHLSDLSIASDVHYPVPDHRQAIFAEQYSTLSLMHTERLAAEILTLPCYPEMSEDQVATVIRAVNGWDA